MAKTLLQIAKEVARRAKVVSPASSIGSVAGNDQLDVVYQAIVDAGDFMLDAHDWSILQTEATLATVASTESYALPSDWHHFIHDTGWDQSNMRQMFGSVTPQLWEWGNNSTVTLSQLRKWFALRVTEGQGADGAIHIFPTPTAVETLSYQYLSQNWAANAAGTPKATMDIDTDTPRIPDHVLSMLATAMAMESEGLPFLNRRNDAERLLEQAIANDATPPVADANRDPVLRRGLWNWRAQWPCNVPDGGFGQ